MYSHIYFQQNLATFTEEQRQLEDCPHMAYYVGALVLNSLKRTDDSLYNFSVFVILTGQNFSTDARKLIKGKALSKCIKYCNCVFYTFALITRPTNSTYVAQYLRLLWLYSITCNFLIIGKIFEKHVFNMGRVFCFLLQILSETLLTARRIYRDMS